MTSSLTLASRATSIDAAAPTPSVAPNPGDPAGFAALLRQSQATPPAHLPTPSASLAMPAGSKADGQAPTPAQTAAAPAEPGSRSESAAPPARTLPKPRGTATSSTRDDRADTDAGPETATAADPSSDGDPEGGPPHARALGDPALDPSVLQWLAAQQRTAHARSGASGAPGEVEATTSADAAALDPATEAGAMRRGTDLRAEPRGRGARASVGAGAEHAPVPTPVSAIDADTAATTPVGATAKDHAGAPAPFAAGLPTAPSSRDAAPAVTVALPVPPNAPEFARALGVQVAVFARDGVQHAELHLNPAEMGPVSVQIAMDGTRAHVQFGADQAPTRQFIEAGMPELASALRDAGFTLAGGGVSQHGGSRSDGQARESRGALTASAPAAPAAPTAVIRRSVRAGGVDLYA